MEQKNPPPIKSLSGSPFELRLHGSATDEQAEAEQQEQEQERERLHQLKVRKLRPEAPRAACDRPRWPRARLLHRSLLTECSLSRP